MIIEFDTQYRNQIIKFAKSKFAHDSIYYNIKNATRDELWNLVERPTHMPPFRFWHEHPPDNFWTIIVEFVRDYIKNDIKTRLI